MATPTRARGDEPMAREGNRLGSSGLALRGLLSVLRRNMLECCTRMVAGVHRLMQASLTEPLPELLQLDWCLLQEEATEEAGGRSLRSCAKNAGQAGTRQRQRVCVSAHNARGWVGGEPDRRGQSDAVRPGLEPFHGHPSSRTLLETGAEAPCYHLQVSCPILTCVSSGVTLLMVLAS